MHRSENDTAGEKWFAGGYSKILSLAWPLEMYVQVRIHMSLMLGTYLLLSFTSQRIIMTKWVSFCLWNWLKCEGIVLISLALIPVLRWLKSGSLRVWGQLCYKACCVERVCLCEQFVYLESNSAHRWMGLCSLLDSKDLHFKLISVWFCL